MKKLLLALALFLLPVAASAQCSGVFPANTVCGNLSASKNVPTAVPFGGAIIGPSTSVIGDCATWANTGGSQLADTPCPITPPSGRLTLVSGSPDILVDMIGALNVYYAPDTNSLVPIYDGTSMRAYKFTASATDQVGLTLPLSSSANFPANTIYDVFVTLSSGVPVLGTRAWDSAMLPAAPAQVTNNTTITTGTTNSWARTSNAFNGTVHQTSANSSALVTTNDFHNCLGQDFGVGNSVAVNQILLTSPTNNFIRGDGPASLSIATYGSIDNTNWAEIDIRNIDSSTQNTQYTIGINNTATVTYRYWRMCFTGDGINSLSISQMQFFTIAGPSTRRLSKFNGILTNDATITTLRTGPTTTLSNIPANQATFLGVIQTDAGAAGAVSAYVTSGPSRVYNIWNAYNQRDLTLQAVVPFLTTGVGPFAYSITSGVYAYVQGTPTFSASVLIGYASGNVNVTMPRDVGLNAVAGLAQYVGGIGLDSNNNISGNEMDITLETSGQFVFMHGTASLVLRPFFGTHTFYGVEWVETPGTGGVISLQTGFINTNITVHWKG